MCTTRHHYTPAPGSISHGTLRTEDLLNEFCSVLDAILVDRRHADHRALLQEAEAADPESGHAADLVDELQDALDHWAPEYCRFGAHEGDGADFGFWPVMEQIEELPQFDNYDPPSDFVGDFRVVTDHGNVTVRRRFGNRREKTILAIV